MTRRFFSVLPALLLLNVISQAKPQVKSRQESKVWSIENDQIIFRIGHFSDGTFAPIDIQDRQSGKTWKIAMGTNIVGLDLELGQHKGLFNFFTSYAHPTHRVENIVGNGRRHSFSLIPVGLPGRIDFNVEIYPGQSFLRTSYSYKNNSDNTIPVSNIDLLNWLFEEGGREGTAEFTAFRVNQWKHGKRNFELLETKLNSSSDNAKFFSGAYGEHCGWVALRDRQSGDGIVAGWEFNGRARGLAQHGKQDGLLRITVTVSAPVNYRVQPGESFESPWSFIGLFNGDWDEAGYRTQRFVEQVLAKPMPEPDKFPYLMFDSWGYGEDINEEKLFQAAKIASELGVEVFTVDLGWAEMIGDWLPDRKKFPRGLKPLSDYVHSLGMKFGLHWPLVQAHLESPVLKQNPDWTSSVDHGYFGAVSLCLGHQLVREWLIREGIRIIREYGVDWILQDGENMVKVCEKTTHTHHPEGSNYANSEKGLDEVIAAIQKATPGVVWENCEDGGNMMTYKMVRQYVTSILSDDAQPLTTRQAVYGGTYPFPPRYSVRYVQDPRETEFSTYYMRSYMFGGPLILMQRITDWNEAQKKLVKKELAIYKSIRTLIRDSKIIHLLERPDGKKNDAIQAYHEGSDRSVIFVYRSKGRKNHELIRPRGLKPDSFYRVKFQDHPLAIIVSGQDLMRNGIEVLLPTKNSAEIVYIEPLK